MQRNLFIPSKLTMYNIACLLFFSLHLNAYARNHLTVQAHHAVNTYDDRKISRHSNNKPDYINQRHTTRPCYQQDIKSNLTSLRGIQDYERTTQCNASNPTQQAGQIRTITLNEVLNRALVKNPEIAQAFASIAQNRASVDLAASAYLPKVEATGQYNWQRTANYNNGFSEFSGNDKGLGPAINTFEGSLNLEWVLFDFGQRSANLSAQKQRLKSIIASQESTSITALIEALQLYTQAYNAYYQLQSLLESEQIAAKSEQVVQALFEAKVAALTEKLQAQTARTQASLERSIAEGNWHIAKGQLAVAIGLPVNTDYLLANENTVFNTVITQDLVNDLLDEVKQHHPKMRSLWAEVDALKSNLKSVKAENKGKLNFVMNGSKGQSNNFDGLGNNLETKNINVGVRATIPLFNWKEQSAREAQLKAQIDQTMSRIMVVRNEVITDLWRNIQEVKMSTTNLTTTDRLLKIADQNYQVAFGRYRSGVGSIVDLLRAQSTLAQAKQQLQTQKVNYMQSFMRLSLATGRFTSKQIVFSK